MNYLYDESLYRESYLEEAEKNKSLDYALQSLFLIKEKQLGMPAADIVINALGFSEKVSDIKKEDILDCETLDYKKIVKAAKKLAKHGYALSSIPVLDSHYHVVSFKSLVHGNYDDSVYNIYQYFLSHNFNYEAVQFYKKSKSKCLDKAIIFSPRKELVAQQ